MNSISCLNNSYHYLVPIIFLYYRSYFIIFVSFTPVLVSMETCFPFSSQTGKAALLIGEAVPIKSEILSPLKLETSIPFVK